MKNPNNLYEGIDEGYDYALNHETNLYVFVAIASFCQTSSIFFQVDIRQLK